jgi:hypothetical protein
MALWLCLFSFTSLAQVTGVATLQGVVTDNSNAVLANAEICARLQFSFAGNSKRNRRIFPATPACANPAQ